MFSLTKLFSAVALLANAISMLATTVSQADAQLRERLCLDVQDSHSGPIVIDQANGTPSANRAADATPDAPAAGRRGKSKATAE